MDRTIIMENCTFHFNVAQDIGHGLTIIFICCVLVIIATLIDLWTGVDAARKNHEQIRSKMLRRTVSKTLDYLRVVIFAVLIDVLGLCFPWYVIPYAAVIVTLGILVIEGKSVLENFKKKKSNAADIVEVIGEILECADSDTAQKIIKKLKEHQ